MAGSLERRDVGLVREVGVKSETQELVMGTDWNRGVSDVKRKGMGG